MSMLAFSGIDAVVSVCVIIGSVFFFNDTATTEIYTLSLHDALPISGPMRSALLVRRFPVPVAVAAEGKLELRSEEHTSELQSRLHIVCRLLLEKKKFNRSDGLPEKEIVDLYLTTCL